MGRRRGGDGEPDVRDHTRAVGLEHLKRTASRDGAGVGIASASVVARLLQRAIVVGQGVARQTQTAGIRLMMTARRLSLGCGASEYTCRQRTEKISAKYFWRNHAAPYSRN